MATSLDKVLKRELIINGRPHVLTLSPEGMKLTVKGHRNGLELAWAELVSGEAALATALNASVGKFETAAGNTGRGSKAVTRKLPVRSKAKSAGRKKSARN